MWVVDFVEEGEEWGEVDYCVFFCEVGGGVGG